MIYLLAVFVAVLAISLFLVWCMESDHDRLAVGTVVVLGVVVILAVVWDGIVTLGLG